MSDVTRAHRDLARWLLAQELGDATEADALLDAAERACQKLCRRLARLVTAAGCQALLTRALRLAAAEFPFLDGVQAGAPAGPCLDGLRERAQGVEAAALRDALTAVLARMIGLLATFIGEDLALRLVRDVWPDAPFGEIGADMREAQA